jgi:hypothetical protein
VDANYDAVPHEDGCGRTRIGSTEDELDHALKPKQRALVFSLRELVVRVPWGSCD